MREVGINLWLDQLDILGGQHWDRAVEEALQTCQGMIAVLSPDALASNNVMDEVSYALEERKIVIPILLHSATLPFRLRRLQYINFTADYQMGFSQLLRALRIDQSLPPRVPAAPNDTVVQIFTAPSKETPKEVPTLEQQPRRAESPESEPQDTLRKLRSMSIDDTIGKLKPPAIDKGKAWNILKGEAWNILRFLAFLAIVFAIIFIISWAVDRL